MVQVLSTPGGPFRDRGGQVGGGGGEGAWLTPVPCLGSRADKGPSGLYTHGLWNSSEETQDKEFYSETGWGRWREKGQRDRRRRRNREDGESTRREVRRQTGQRSRARLRDTGTEGDRGQRDRQPRTQGHEGHTRSHVHAARASAVSWPHPWTHLEPAVCAGQRGLWPEPGGQHPGARGGPRALGDPELGSSG